MAVSSEAALQDLGNRAGPEGDVASLAARESFEHLVQEKDTLVDKLAFDQSLLPRL